VDDYKKVILQCSHVPSQSIKLTLSTIRFVNTKCFFFASATGLSLIMDQDLDPACLKKGILQQTASFIFICTFRSLSPLQKKDEYLNLEIIFNFLFEKNTDF
jgi:hypothetical protein